MRKSFSIVFSVALLLIGSAQLTWAQKPVVYELGTYPGGTWVEMGDINDSGVAVGVGDISTGQTRPFAIALSGPHAKQWIDLGTLGGDVTGYREAVMGIAENGMIVGYAATAEGYLHAFAWTEQSGMIDLGTLAGLGHTYSQAAGTNHIGNLVVGFSGTAYDIGPPTETSIPVVWTPSPAGKAGESAPTWEIHQLDTTGFEQFSYWWVVDVNDFGQITGIAWDSFRAIGVLWDPLPNGKGWKVRQLPLSTDTASANTFGINNRGEIAGWLFDVDIPDGRPVLWKPLDPSKEHYSLPFVLKTPEDMPAGWADGINEVGDIVGACYGPGGNQAVRWSTKDPNFVQLLGFPGDGSYTYKVNNRGIAIGQYWGGGCAGMCGAAVRFR